MDKHTYNTGFRAMYRGEYLGTYDTAKQAWAAIAKARKADAKEQAKWERKRP